MEYKALGPHFTPVSSRFLERQVARYGRHHPIIASEYFLEPLSGAGGLFPPWRRALMGGDHAHQQAPEKGKTYVATIDVAGQDEAATNALAALDNPGRDYTVATIFEIDSGASHVVDPIYRAVDVFVDQGSRHFQDVVGRPRLSERLLAYLRHWQAGHVVVDSSGVGQGLADWMSAQLGAEHVTPFTFSGRSAKAALGSDFLALVDTGRFKYWVGDEDRPLSDGWWFWQQVATCTYSLSPNGRFERDLRWSVPSAAKIDTPNGRQLIHDDRLLSAALVVEIERLRRQGKLVVGRSESVVIGSNDPVIIGTRSPAAREQWKTRFPDPHHDA